MSRVKKIYASNSFKDILLRISLLWIVLLSIPIQQDFYSILLSLSWQYLLIDFYNLVTFLPHFFDKNSTILDWTIYLGIAVALALLWRSRQPHLELNKWYYYLRIFSRYKLASILLVAGFLKVFALYVPEISLSHLNTGYGYFQHWKHLLLSLSAAPAYLVFLGIVEVAAAILLLFRRTAFLGVIFIIPFYGNVFLADLAYEGGDFLVSTYIVLLSLPVFVYDLGRLGRLIYHKAFTQPAAWHLEWNHSRWKKVRVVGKISFAVFFFFVVGFKSYSAFRQQQNLFYPQHKGLEGIVGKYWVKDFVLNGDTIAPSPFENGRWKDVVFERWNTLSIRVNESIVVEEPASRLWPRQDSLRNYEYTQVGDRLYYTFQFSEQDSILTLANRNKHYITDSYRFQLSQPDSNAVLLRGTNGRGDSLQVLLVDAKKKYLLEEVKKVGRRKVGYKL